MIEKLRRALYGRRSERTERLLDQLELALDELTASASEDEPAAEKAAPGSTEVKAFTRRKPSRKPFPDHLPRERVVVPAPDEGCAAVEGADRTRLSKVGEDSVTETLEVIRAAPLEGDPDGAREVHLPELREDLSAAGAVPRGAAGLGGSEPAGHDPVREVRAAPAAEPSEGSLRERGRRSQPVTLADQVGACTVALKPLHDLIAAHVLAASRLHGDDTTVPVLAKGKTDIPHGPGSMCATTRRSLVRTRRRRCSATRGIARAITRSSICRASPGSFRPTPGTHARRALTDTHGPAERVAGRPMRRDRGRATPLLRRTPLFRGARAWEAVAKWDLHAERWDGPTSAANALRQEARLQPGRWRAPPIGTAKLNDVDLAAWRWTWNCRRAVTRIEAPRALHHVAVSTSTREIEPGSSSTRRPLTVRRLATLVRPCGERSAPERRRRRPSTIERLERSIWSRTERSALSRHAAVAKAMDYMLKRWDGFARFLDDGQICLTNNAAERALRGIALGRKSWLFAGSDRGGVRAAAMYTLIGTAKLNDVDPQAWLADVLNRIADLPQTRLHELLPWNWKGEQQQALAA